MTSGVGIGGIYYLLGIVAVVVGGGRRLVGRGGLLLFLPLRGTLWGTLAKKTKTLAALRRKNTERKREGRKEEPGRQREGRRERERE